MFKIILMIRSARVNIFLGRLLKASALRDQAILVYKEALRQLPFSVEIMEELLDLGVSSHELLSLVDEQFRKKSGLQSTGDVSFLGDRLPLLVSSLAHKRAADSEVAIEKLTVLSSHYPKCVYLCTSMAAALAQAERTSDALQAFRKARQIDPYSLHMMDVYGYLLYSAPDGDAELSQLTSDLMAIDNMRSSKGRRGPRCEAWSVAALFCERKGESDKAIQLIETAISVNSSGASFVFRLKGLLLLNHNHFEQAVICFRQANAVQRDVENYAGLVKAYIEVSLFILPFSEGLTLCDSLAS